MYFGAYSYRFYVVTRFLKSHTTLHVNLVVDVIDLAKLRPIERVCHDRCLLQCYYLSPKYLQHLRRAKFRSLAYKK